MLTAQVIPDDSTLLSRVCATLSLVVAASVLLLPTAVHAQGTGAVSGQVVDASTRESLSGVQVYVEGTQIGTVTDEGGQFRLTGISSGSVRVVASLIGYQEGGRTVEVSAGQVAQLDFRLQQTALELEQIVVTGTAGEQIRGEQPAQVASVDAEAVTETSPVASMGDLLQSRTPGVTLTQGSGLAGTTQRIRVRGAASISLSNRPLIFIDGVRINGSSQRIGFPGSSAGSGGDVGGQTTSRLNDLSPDDIERVEVVKGPAAATLYGADASAGVIQIFTKKGSQGGGFRQTIQANYGNIDPNWTPPANYAICTQSHIDSGVPICQGKQAGALVSDNPLLREGILEHGQAGSLGWNGRGGVEDFSYFFSADARYEDGTALDNEYKKANGRTNVTWLPSDEVTVNLNYGFNTTSTELIDQNHSLYGLTANAMLGSPLTVGVEPQDGWLATRDGEAIAAIRNHLTTYRHTPSVRVSVNPTDWLQSRLVAGGDFATTQSVRHYPKNNQNWYRGIHNEGEVHETRRINNIYTLDYLNNIRQEVGDFRMDFALGLQLISENQDAVWGVGRGLATNAANAISAASERSGGQRVTIERSIGYMSQLSVTHRNRLTLQLGLRRDQNSSFGDKVNAVYLPKAGISYQLHREGFFQEAVPFVDNFRLRFAYGATGRAPEPGASLETYQPSPFVTPSGSQKIGVQLLNPGNPDLEPERGTEFEGGVDLSMFDNRLGLQLTYFNKVSEDLLLRQELPVSAGFLADPWVNVGEVVNRGFEASVNAQFINSSDLAWRVRVGASTLHNELRDLGDIPSFGTFRKFAEGRPLSAFYSQTVQRVDTDRGVAIVSDTMEFLGSPFPSFEGSFGTDVTVFDQFRISALLDGQTGFLVDNGTAQFRETGLVRSKVAIDPNYFDSEAAKLRRLGPFETESGQPVSRGEILEPYFEEGDFLKFRELMVSYLAPTNVARLLGAREATISVGGRNLAIWSKYSGPDPESSTDFFFENFALHDDFFNIPPARRWTARVSLSF